MASVNSRGDSSGLSSDPHSGSNHSTSHGHHNHTVPPKHSSHQTAPLNQSGGTGSTSNSHHKHPAPLSPRRNIVVTVWKKGFKYQEWVSKNSPFYINDVLVYKYNNNKENNVYLLQDLRSYMGCDVRTGKKLVARGGSSGRFKLLLQRRQTYYFASADGCNHTKMQFALNPWPRP
ncbi:unnamed protein product [Arabis nemorensis]|uniref:Phytocyanin domain-containing protein n=1 Tax=Arabis nemorensis TaxID=586526 RepID=A0A565B160_9BRAS|nr:unnamed protein product [Arabis nemorensis]